MKKSKIDIRKEYILELQKSLKCDYAYAEKMCEKLYTLAYLSFDLYKESLTNKSKD